MNEYLSGRQKEKCSIAANFNILNALQLDWFSARLVVTVNIGKSLWVRFKDVHQVLKAMVERSSSARKVRVRRQSLCGP